MGDPDGHSETESKEFHAFPTPFEPAEDSLEPPHTLHEIKMARLSYEIRTTKDDWARKVLDPEIRAKWRAEILEQEAKDVAERDAAAVTATVDMIDDDAALEKDSDAWLEAKTAARDAADRKLNALTETMVDYVLDELQFLAQSLKDPKGNQVSCFPKIYEATSIVPPELRARLLEGFDKLESAHGEKDWHPGSKDQVLDLVHPSLYPIRYSKTLALNADDSSGFVVLEPPPPKVDDGDQSSLSVKYCWLPTDFVVDAKGAVTIDGYINNLHPVVYASLYPVIASIFEKFVPLFECVLTDLQTPPPRPLPDVDCNWYIDTPDGDLGDIDDSSDYWENRPMVLPEPKAFDPPKYERKVFRLSGRTLQVIVKLANIILTPEQPSYDGGVFHVEGMQNENIVASGIYYAQQENIGESRLAFRGTFDDTRLPYEQSDDRGVKIVYGIVDEGPCHQDLNSAVTSEHKAIAFPNIYQHCVSPFSLVDPTRPGFRRILCFFLVDPLQPMPSTKVVPPQQLDWLTGEIDYLRENYPPGLPQLPTEIWDQILEDTELMSLERAKEVRKDLMQERKFFVGRNNEALFARPFSLCEH